MSTEKSFAQGSAAPGPVPQGSIRIYSMRFCPYALRARLVLNAKGIKHEIVNINLKDKPDWFLQKNPLGLVPTLETPAGEVIYESPITCEYLDEVYPEKKLFPSSPFEKAQQKMLLEQFSKITPYFYKILVGKTNGNDVSGLEAELKEHIIKLDAVLSKKKTKFFGGNSITMIDYLIWPWFEMREAFVQHLLDNTTELKKWTEHMLEDPVVKASGHSPDSYKTFYKNYINGTPNFDLGL